MDRLQRRNPSRRPHSASLKPPRPPRGPTFHPPPASRPLPEPSSPDERQRKKVRFANEAGSHQIGGRPVANIPEAARSKRQVCGAKTAEFKFFKKLCEQSGHRSHSYKHSHPSSELYVSKRKQDLHNVTPLRKVSVQKNTVCCDGPPVTPSKNEEITSEQVNVLSSHSEYEKDTPNMNSDDYVPHIHVLTPIAQTSFEITGISRNVDREPVSGQVFSEKRSKLLKLAANTVSMGSAELLQRRSEFLGNVLQRLGTNNIIRKQREGSTRHRKFESRQAPATSKGHADSLLDYKQSEFDPLSRLKTLGQKSSNDESFEFMALPCGYNQSLPGFSDWKNGFSRIGNETRECIKDILSSDQNRGIVHNQVSNFLLKDVESCIPERSASGNELSLNIQSASYDRHGWDSMLSLPVSESFRDRLSLPYHIEEQHAVPHAISNAYWQPDFFSSMERCISGSGGLIKARPEEAGWCDNSDAGFSTRSDQLLVKPTASCLLESGNEALDHNEAGWCDNSDAGFSTRFDQLLVKSTASCLLESGNEAVDHNDIRCVSSFHASQSNSMVLSANTSYPSLICSTPEHPYELHPMSFHFSAIGVSCFAGPNEKHSREVELSDNSGRLLEVLDQLPLLSTFPNGVTSSWDRHHLRLITSCPMNDCGSTLFLEANDPGLNSLSSCSEHPCKQYSNYFDDSSTELWPSMHQLQAHTSLGAVLGLMSNESSYSDTGHQDPVLVQSNLNSGILGANDLSSFDSFSAMDNIREAPMLSSDGILW